MILGGSVSVFSQDSLVAKEEESIGLFPVYVMFICEIVYFFLWLLLFFFFAKSKCISQGNLYCFREESNEVKKEKNNLKK